MITIQARNVNDALWAGASMLREAGVQSDSRNGPVLRAPMPVTTVYNCPTERVMLHPGRDANPFFHLVEALWMIAGRDDLATLTPYVKNMVNFSDDGGKTQMGAYGKRWRAWFKHKNHHMDQLAWAVARLKADPNDRRVVIQMYDAEIDQHMADNGGKDIPCNLMALPAISVEGKLDLTVFNRSNDMVWGAYGANAVHFSVLQEVMASLLGVPVGNYYQVSNNFHGYLATMDKAGQEWPWGAQELNGEAYMRGDPYVMEAIRPMEMFPGLTLEEITDDIEVFLKEPTRTGIRSDFLRKVACPMVIAHKAFKSIGGAKGIEEGREVLLQMPEDNDWRAGAEQWFFNRSAKLRRAQDDGVSHDASAAN